MDTYKIEKRGKISIILLPSLFQYIFHGSNNTFRFMSCFVTYVKHFHIAAKCS